MDKETVAFEGKPLNEFKFAAKLGTPLLILGIVLALVWAWSGISFFTQNSVTSLLTQIPDYLYGLCLAWFACVGFGLMLLWMRRDRKIPRMLELDSIGMRLYRKKWKEFNVKWTDIRELGTKKPLKGNKEPGEFYFCTDDEQHIVNAYSMMGPVSILRKAFHEIAIRAANPSKYLVDELGWAKGLENKYGIPRKNKLVYDFENKWHFDIEPKAWLNLVWFVVEFAVLFTILLAVVIFVFGEAEFWISMLVIIWLLVALLVIVCYIEKRMSPSAIRFNTIGIDFRFPSGIEKNTVWSEVRNLVALPNAKNLRISVMNRFYNLSYPLEVCEAVRICYLLSKPNKA